MTSTNTWASTLAKLPSKLVGRSGRVYVRDRVLHARPERPDLNIHLAYCENRPFVLKPTSRSIFELSQELRSDFGDDSRLRTHIDENESENVLVYEYFQDNLLSFVNRNPGLSIEKRKSILRELGLGLSHMHNKDWIHLDLKPDNVLLNWSRDRNAQFNIERVALGDLDCALKLDGDKLLNHRMGNVMWRSPEGQTGTGIGKPSEVFSFGLVCLFTMTGAETLHPDFEQLKRDGTEPEDVILYKLLSMFGPVPSEFIAHINDPCYRDVVVALSEGVAEEDPSVRFKHWRETDFPNLNPESKSFIMKMTNLDPRNRATLAQIVEDPWWG